MGKTLYFSNNESRSCWPVRRCVGDPAPEGVRQKSGPYRNNCQTVIESSTAPGLLILGHTGKVVFPGRLTGLKTTSGVMLGPWLNGTQVVNGELNDEASGAALRQSEVEHTHWKVMMESGEDEPGYCLISMERYPDGYSLRPPSWWTDPTPDAAG